MRQRKREGERVIKNESLTESVGESDFSLTIIVDKYF